MGSGSLNIFRAGLQEEISSPGIESLGELARKLGLVNNQTDHHCIESWTGSRGQMASSCSYFLCSFMTMGGRPVSGRLDGEVTELKVPDL